MNWQRVKTMLLHTWYHFHHSMETWVDLFFNSALQMFLFAFLARYFSAGANTEAGMYLLLGMILWNIIWAAQYAIAIGALWEIWSKSFSGLFMTPLTLEEFLIAQMASGIIKSLVAFTLTGLIGLVLYQFSVFNLGAMLPIYIIELLIFGWTVGLFVLSLIFRFGLEVQSLSWAIVFLVQPFGGVFYPVSVLPEFIQKIAYSLPVSYIFETARIQLTTAIVRWDFLLYATLLNVVYLLVSYWFLKRTFSRAKQNGSLARLEG